MLTIDKVDPSVTFKASPKSANELRKALEQSVKNAKQTLKSGSNAADKQKILEDVVKLAEETEKQAGKEAKEKLNNSKFGSKLDKTLDSVFTWVVKKFGKSDNMIKKNKSTEDLIKSVTKVVLIGNVLKEVVGTILYTTQAMTNEDLPQDKRKFVGLYDLCVGVVSTTVSLILGVGFQDSIRKGYAKLLKPVADKLPRSAAFIGTAAAFTSFALQTIVGKRIIAPAIATPAAGKLKQKMMEKEEAKQQAKKA